MRQCTFQFFVETASTRYGECAYEFFEIDGTVLVFVKDIEDVIRELAGVAEWEKLFVNTAELCFIKLSRGAVLSETFVPLL